MSIGAGKPEQLHVGSGRLRINGMDLGQLNDAYVTRGVEKLSHMTNFTPEYGVDHVLPMSRQWGVGGRLDKPFNPQNLNLGTGAAGYSGVPYDFSLPGSRVDLDIAALGNTKRQLTGYSRLVANEDGIGIYSPLPYPISQSGNTQAQSFILTVRNVGYTGGTPLGYSAFIAVGHTSGAGANTSLPSRIEIVPYTAAADALTAYLKIDTNGSGNAQPTHYSLYRADAARLPNGQYEFTTAFTLVTAFTNEVLGAVPGAGYWTITQNGALAPFLNNNPVAGAYSSPITVQQYEDNNTLTSLVFALDYLFEWNHEAGAAIKIAPSPTTAVAGRRIKWVYWYDTLNVALLPMHTVGTNPILPVEFELVLPNKKSKIIWDFFKGQIDSSNEIRPSSQDWTGSNLDIMALDASDVYPNWGYGRIIVIGELTEEIMNYANFGFGSEQTLLANQTTHG